MAWIPEAHAEGAIQCSAFQAEQIITYGAKQEKAEAAAKAHGDRVAAWLMTTSGDVVFRSSLVQNQGAAFIDVVCVR